MALGALSYHLKTLVDTLFVGWLGPSELAGVGVGGTIATLLLCFPIGQLDSLRVLVSQAVGARKLHRALDYLRAALLLAGVLGAVVLVAGRALLPWVGELAGSSAAGASARAYFGVMILGAPIALLQTGLKDGREGLGDARSPMISAMIGNAANVGLNYTFIFVFGWGVSGAAWASVAAALIELAIVLRVQLRHGFGRCAIDKGDVLTVWRLGVPMGVQFALGVGAFSIMAVLIAGMGEAQMAGHQIALHVTHLSFLPTMALAGALSVIVGQAVGAGRDDLVRVTTRRALRLQLIYVGVVALVFWSGAGLIGRFFSSDQATFEVATRLLRISVFLQLFDGAYTISRAGLRGTGDVRSPAILGVVIGWVCTPPLTWLLGDQLGLGAAGGWIGLCAEMLVGAGVMWFRLERGWWRSAMDELRGQTDGMVPGAEDAEAVPAIVQR